MKYAYQGRSLADFENALQDYRDRQHFLCFFPLFLFPLYSARLILNNPFFHRFFL